MANQHDFLVSFRVDVEVQADNAEQAKEGAKELIQSDPSEYIEDAEILEVQDRGESRTQY